MSLFLSKSLNAAPNHIRINELEIDKVEGKEEV